MDSLLIVLLIAILVFIIGNVLLSNAIKKHKQKGIFPINSNAKIEVLKSKIEVLNNRVSRLESRNN